MRLQSFHVRNFRRLKDVDVELSSETSIFVGSNNSGKTSAAHIFQLFLGSSRDRFSVHDFSADCWAIFDRIGAGTAAQEELLPRIVLDLWFDVSASDIHRVVPLLPNLAWDGVPVGLRMEFAPKDADTLLEHFHEEKGKAEKHAERKEEGKDGFHPWPKNLSDYMKRHLNSEYKIFYYVLDHSQFEEGYKERAGYAPQPLGDSIESGAKIIQSLLRVDFLGAQRHLSDSESRGRAEDLSRRLSRFYERNLKQIDDDYSAVRSLENSEAELNKHLAAVFKPTLHNLNKLGYPGFADPDLVIKSAFNPESILTKNASVHYALRDPGTSVAAENYLTLPDKYNGLGFKNLIYMVIEVLDFHEQWAGGDNGEEGRPLLHLIVIEEPEAHLHVQLQQVFIKKIREILPTDDEQFTTQMIVTTHSPHIIYESDFLPIRYFRRSSRTAAGNYSEVLNLSRFNPQEESTRDFLLKYMKLTHCDLFFADAAVLVEGSVERLLLPLMIKKVTPELQSSYLSILELGGAFAHLFQNLIQFLGLTTLVITDLDSILEAGAAAGKSTKSTKGKSKSEELGYEEQDEGARGKSCMTDELNAVTSNQTLKQWIPKREKIVDLLATDNEEKAPSPTSDAPASVRVAFQTREKVSWNGDAKEIAGRTFEEAFAYENLDWCQDLEQRSLHLRVVTKNNQDSIALEDVTEKIHKRVKSNGFRKSDFALALIMKDLTEWEVPKYISEGLSWLSDQLTARSVEPVAAAAEGERKNDSTN